MKYTSEQREEIMRTARENIARGVSSQPPLEEEELEPIGYELEEPRVVMPPLEDPLDAWRRRGAEFERMRQQGRSELRASEQRIIERMQQQRNDNISELIARALEERDQFWIDSIGAALAEERAKMRAEFAKQIEQLRTELTSKERGARSVIDLPVRREIG